MNNLDVNTIKVIAFDADDTLWVNETYFREAENEFVTLLSEFGAESLIHKKLYQKEIQNLEAYGYGVKGFVLSMVECALEVSNYKVSSEVIEQILQIGKRMLKEPLKLIDGIEHVLSQLQKKYKLVVATKGDLLDQEKKVKRSSLSIFFSKVYVMSNKKEENYQTIIDDLEINPDSLLMIGNSIKSDVLPVVKLGGKAIHIPFHTTWIHEEVSNAETSNLDYITLKSVKDLIPLL